MNFATSVPCVAGIFTTAPNSTSAENLNTSRHVIANSRDNTVRMTHNAVLRGLTVALLAGAMAIASPGVADAARKSKTAVAKPDEPILVVISLGKQRLTVFHGKKPIASSRISSGKSGHRTPMGVFTILQKRRKHYSNIYAGASMPNMQRLTWSGIAMHAGHVPGYPASHGCIRLPYSFSKQLFSMTDMHGRVVVTSGQPTPISISHANLIKPLPPGIEENIAEQETQRDRASVAPSVSAGRAAASMLIGVSPANAAETPAEQLAPKTRASVKAERARRIAHLTAALIADKNAQAEMGVELKQANVALIEQAKAIRLREIETRKVAGKLADQQKQLAAAQRKIRDFLLQNQLSAKSDAGVQAASGSEDELAKLEAAEEALEAEVLSITASIELISNDLNVLQSALDEQNKKMDEGILARDELKKSYVAASERRRKTSAELETNERLVKNADKPITAVISRKTGTITVRQGWSDLMTAEVEIDRPEAPLGTQVFLAKRYTADGNDLDWYALTADVNDTTSKSRSKKTRKKVSRRDRSEEIKVAANGDVPMTLPLPAQTPQNAIARVKIPDVVAAQLAEHIKPGSAIIITDEGRSNEIGDYTDLIVNFR